MQAIIYIMPASASAKAGHIYIKNTQFINSIRSYGTPNGTGRCSMAQCYDNISTKHSYSHIELQNEWLVTVFLIRSYGTPNGTGRCSMAQCYDNTWATLAQSKIKFGQYCQLVVALLHINIHCN